MSVLLRRRLPSSLGLTVRSRLLTQLGIVLPSLSVLPRRVRVAPGAWVCNVAKPRRCPCWFAEAHKPACERRLVLQTPPCGRPPRLVGVRRAEEVVAPGVPLRAMGPARGQRNACVVQVPVRALPTSPSSPRTMASAISPKSSSPPLRLMESRAGCGRRVPSGMNERVGPLLQHCPCIRAAPCVVMRMVSRPAAASTRSMRKRHCCLAWSASSEVSASSGSVRVCVP